MAHFAELDDSNTVLQVIVLANETCGEPELAFPDTEPVGRAFIAQTLGLGWNWKQTSYSGTIRGKFAGIGDFYDATTDKFYPADWTLVDGVWQAPPVETTEEIVYE